METNLLSKGFRLIVVLYGLAYGLLYILPLLTIDNSVPGQNWTRAEAITTVSAFLIYLIGAIALFYNEKVAAIILQLWHFSIWVFALSVWRDSGMGLILGLPLLYVAVFIMLNWYVKNDAKYQLSHHRWGLVMNLLTLNYTGIYLWIALAQIGPKAFGWEFDSQVDQLGTWEYSIFSKIVLLVLLALYLTGVGISKKSKWIAGLIFVIWYISVLIMSHENMEFGQAAPFAMFGVVILVQGVLYLAYYMNKNEFEHQQHKKPV